MPLTAASQAPADQEQVISAFRFAWAIAELRGRYRPNIVHVEDEAPVLRAWRAQHALPLANERSPRERRIEVSSMLDGLSQELDLQFPDRLDAEGKTAIQRVGQATKVLDDDPTDAAAWNKLTEAFYSWDADIQDALVLKPHLAAAYQLARGLAETYWDLDQSVETSLDFRAWTFLLGPERRATVQVHLAQLAAYVEPLTLPAIATSLDRWGEIAADGRWRANPEARLALFRQGLLWRDLVCGQRRPQDLDQHGRKALAAVGVLWPLLRTLWPQLLIGAVSAVALLVGAAQLAASSSNTHSNALYSLLGGLGITSAGLYARAKATATSLLTVIRQAFDADRAGRAATIEPHAPAMSRVKPSRLVAMTARQLGSR